LQNLPRSASQARAGATMVPLKWAPRQAIDVTLPNFET